MEPHEYVGRIRNERALKAYVEGIGTNSEIFEDITPNKRVDMSHSPHDTGLNSSPACVSCIHSLRSWSRIANFGSSPQAGYGGVSRQNRSSSVYLNTFSPGSSKGNPALWFCSDGISLYACIHIITDEDQRWLFGFRKTTSNTRVGYDTRRDKQFQYDSRQRFSPVFDVQKTTSTHHTFEQ